MQRGVMPQEKRSHDWSTSDPGPILSVRRLASLLAVSIEALEKLADQAGRHYCPFDRRNQKGSGKWRHIDNPYGPLKGIQSKIHQRILLRYRLPDRMVGGVAGCSILDHAKYHVRQPLVVTLDIRSCFPSINHKRIFSIFHLLLGCSTDVSSILTKLTSFQYRLPQGAPTSSILANMALLKLYDDIEELSKKLGLEFSMYVDDIALSGPGAARAINPISDLIKKYGLRMAWRKVKLLPASRPQEITGLQVNRGLDISNEKIGILRSDILQLSDSPVILERDLQRIQGRIGHIGRVNPIQGMLLGALAFHHLPDISIPGGERRGEVRTCRNFHADHLAESRSEALALLEQSA